MKKIITLVSISLLMLFITNLPITAQWVRMTSGNMLDTAHVYSLGTIGNNVLAGTVYNGVSYSTNNGGTWIQSSLNNRWINSFAVSGNNIFGAAVTYSAGIYMSTNNGVDWTSTSLNNVSIAYLAANGNYIFAGKYEGQEVYLSTNGGVSWTLNPLNDYIDAFAFLGNYTFAGDNYGHGVYVSTNNGTSWTQTSLNMQGVGSLAASGNNIIAGTAYYCYLSTNDGTNWTYLNIYPDGVDCFAVSGNSVFAGNGYGIYVSNNNGANWTLRNEGIPDTAIGMLAICVNGQYIYAADYKNGIYRRPLSEVIGIKQISQQLPEKYSLSQNYPNPFNPSTKIKFDLPKGGFVKLVVYDVMGREMETLVNERLQSGVYETEWNADKYPSGAYFYKIVVDDNINNGSFVQTRKMILVK